jgi:hypothetical protein
MMEVDDNVADEEILEAARGWASEHGLTITAEGTTEESHRAFAWYPDTDRFYE